MRYIFGIDGGGTKTQCLVGNEAGDILGEGFGGPANYQTVGIETTKASIKMALTEALAHANLNAEDMAYGVYGLSSADSAIDFKVLEPMCASLIEGMPFEVLNDTWIGLKSGSPYGVISICGTGSGHAGISKNGQRHILRNLDYLLGNQGGGNEIADSAIHFAFRSDEHTYKKTRLEVSVPELFELENMEAVADYLRQYEVPKKVAYNLPIITLRLSDEGDLVAREIVTEMGKTLGLYASAVGVRLGMADEEVPMVLIGSVFGSRNAIFIEAYMNEVKKKLPNAFPVIPEKAPVYGAFELAKEAL